jgi:GTPase SAR1 family protein
MQENHLEMEDNTVDTTPSKRSRTDSGNSSTVAPASSTVSSSNTNKGTIYITIGPQCAGKTTLLKQLFGESFHKNEETTSSTTPLKTGGMDITIDDQALVYIPVPHQYFLYDSVPNATNMNDISSISMTTLIMGKTIQERIKDPSNDELRWVICRLGGVMSSEQFASLIRGNATLQTEVISESVHDDVIAAVEDMISSKDSNLPEKVDLFIVESIFRPRPLDLLHNIPGVSTNPKIETSALDAALDLLNSHATNNQTHSTSAPLAWGNTNTRPREYKSALDAACQSGRPVEFIVFGGMEACDMIREHKSRREYRMSHEADGNRNNSDEEDGIQILCLPKLTRLELLKRNLHRFSKTGRYIPSVAINDAMVRVDSLLASAVAEAKKDCDPNSELLAEKAKFRLDLELAKLAGFELNNDRTVSISQMQSFERDTGRVTHEFSRSSREYSSGRLGQGRGGRGQNMNENYQGRNSGRQSNVSRSCNQGRGYNGGRWNGGRESNWQPCHYTGRSQNNYEYRGRNQAGRSNDTRYQNNSHSNINSNNHRTQYNHARTSQNQGYRHPQNNRYHANQGRHNSNGSYYNSTRDNDKSL